MHKKQLIELPTSDLKLSEYNPRQTRTEDQIDRLAQRITRNGFESTRALWIHRNGSGYEVFAGGIRLEAARQASLETVP